MIKHGSIDDAPMLLTIVDSNGKQLCSISVVELNKRMQNGEVFKRTGPWLQDKDGIIQPRRQFIQIK